MSISGTQGQLLEVTVVGCNKLKDTEWISRQDPYVCLQYGSTKYRTRTHTDGGKNPVFQEKFGFTMIEGLRELNVDVWNSNTVKHDHFIGSGKIQLQKVLTEGFDDTAWTIHTRNGRSAGEVTLILHYSKANKPATTYAPSAPAQGLSQSYEVPRNPVPPPSTASYNYPLVSYRAPSPYPGDPLPPSAYPPSTASYNHLPGSHPAPSPYPGYPPPPSASAYSPAPPPYPPPPSAYPPAPASYPPPSSTYPPAPASYPPPYGPPSVYPPAPYPPPPSAPPHYPPESYHGAYPRPPY